MKPNSGRFVPQKLKLITDEKERTDFFFEDESSEQRMVDSFARSINGALSYSTGIPLEVRLVNQNDYPLHMVGFNCAGFVVFKRSNVSTARGAWETEYVPGHLYHYQIIDWVGPSYKSIDFWFAIPTHKLVEVPGEHHYFTLKKINETNGACYKIHPKKMGRLMCGRKWLASSKSSILRTSPKED